MPAKYKNQSKFIRDEDPPPIYNFKNYLPLLELINNYRFISSSQIIALTPTHRVNTYKKLRRLYQNRFVERFALMSDTFRFREIVYALTRKGADLLRDHFPDRFRSIFWVKGRRSALFLEHAVMVSNFRAALTQGLEQAGTAEIARWKLEAEIVKIFPALEKERLTPDAYFMIWTKNVKLHYFFEADRGTMTLSRFYDKVRRYRAFFRKSRKLKNFPRRFRVLTLATTKRRAQNLCTVTVTEDPEERGSERFWFIHEKQFNLEQPKALLVPLCVVGLKGAESRREGLIN